MSNENTEYPDHLELLAELSYTNPDEWEPTSGPDSGCGTDFYYHHPYAAKEAWLNVDQNYIHIELDGNLLFSGVPDE